MRTRLKVMVVLAFAASLLALPGTANAVPSGWNYHYILSGNGEMFYYTATNKLWIRDLKNGDTMYAQVGFTNAVCGSQGDACAPGSWQTVRNAGTGAGYEEGHGPFSPSGRYALLKLCNDDFPPDTCSRWKRVTA